MATRRRRRKGINGIDMRYDLPTDAELQRMFNMVDKMDRFKVTNEVLDAGCEPIVRMAQLLAPKGAASGVKPNKRSKKQQAAAKWNIPLWQTIAHVVRKYWSGGVGVVGPKWPEGNKAYFNTSERGRDEVLWGHRTGRNVPRVRNWIVMAFDRTRPLQLSNMKAKLTQLMDKVMKAK